MGAPAAASVVIPSRNRPESLRRTLQALRQQDAKFAWEVVVVDDGSIPPLGPSILGGLPDARLVKGPARGPAAARNAGVAAAQGKWLVFTDDDTEPAPTWLRAAVEHLESHPDHLGVEGPVASPVFDPLRAMSLENDRPGAYWTCNMAFARPAFEEVGGFDEHFPNPHCEDLDLAFRLLQRGAIGFAPDMRMLHHPRDMSYRELIERGKLTSSEVRLFERHRQRYGGARRLPARVFPVVQSIGFWRYMLRAAGRDPARVVRALALGAGYSAHAAGVAIRGGR